MALSWTLTREDGEILFVGIEARVPLYERLNAKNVQVLID